MLAQLHDSHTAVYSPQDLQPPRDQHRHAVFGMSPDGFADGPAVDWKTLAPGVGYLRITSFPDSMNSVLRWAMSDLGHDRALVLDLRGNPGGLVDEAVSLVGIFVPKGSPVVTTVGLHDPRQTLKTHAAPATTLPIVVLVDRYSASASEIVSGALRDDGRAILVGERTFGKAVVQETVELPNRGALHFTIARYLTPQGLDLNHRGLTPNIVITTSPTATSDPALQRAAAAAAAGR